MKKLTLEELSNNQHQPAYQFVVMTINDLWGNYMYNVRQLNDADVDKVDMLDVAYFQKWCKQEMYQGIAKYLPKDRESLQAIIKWCGQQVAN